MKIGVLFACLGNICRSPAAEGAFKDLVEKRGLQSRFKIDSCGTASYHIGELPHSRTRSVAKSHGIHLNARARQFHAGDFTDFDHILAMDRANYEDLLAMTSSEKEKSIVQLFRKYDSDLEGRGDIPDVPDPYYGGIEGFENVQKIVSRASKGLLEHLVREHSL